MADFRYCPRCGRARVGRLQFCAECGFDYEEIEMVEVVDDLAGGDADGLLHEAMRVIAEYDRASASLLQRRLNVGYARAARMIDQLEARGYIGAFDGSNARRVLRRDTQS